jgi:hypothetical protein
MMGSLYDACLKAAEEVKDKDGYIAGGFLHAARTVAAEINLVNSFSQLHCLDENGMAMTKAGVEIKLELLKEFESMDGVYGTLFEAYDLAKKGTLGDDEKRTLTKIVNGDIE